MSGAGSNTPNVPPPAGSPNNATVGPPVAPPGALLAPRGRTRVILSPEEAPTLTSYRETDARSALCRGLAEYLQDHSLEFPGGRRVRLVNVYDQWPEPEQEILLPALTCIPHGEGVYDAKSLTPTIDPGQQLAAPDGRFPLAWAELVQPIDVELHANDPAEREQLMALIEDAFAPVDWMSGFKLELPHYFGQFAQFLPQTVGYPDTAETAIQRQRIVDFRIEAHVEVLSFRNLATFRIEQQLSVGVGIVTAAVGAGPLVLGPGAFGAAAIPDIDP